MVRIPNFREHRNDNGIDADDRSSLAIPLLRRIEHVRLLDRIRSLAECAPSIEPVTRLFCGQIGHPTALSAILAPALMRTGF